MNPSLIRRSVLACSSIGALLFGAALLASLLDPGLSERMAREAIRMQVEKQVHRHIDALDAGFLARQAGRMAEDYARQIARAKKLLEEQLPERLARVIAEMRNLDCECRKQVESRVRNHLERGIADATEARERLTTLIRTQYMRSAERLTREFRIFMGANALVCALLAAVAWLRPRADVHLLPAALVLLGSVVLTASLYLFNQDWLATVVFNDYVGWGYFAYLGVAFAFLSDIAFNRARITVRLLDSAISSAGSVIVPC